MDINKWNFGQMTSNADGKTSSSGTMGSLICAASVIGFMFGVCDYIWGTGKPDVMMYATGFAGIGAGLLGYRKSKAKDKPKTDEANGSEYIEQGQQENINEESTEPNKPGKK